jgi:Lar family restriction alleviation protein
MKENNMKLENEKHNNTLSSILNILWIIFVVCLIIAFITSIDRQTKLRDEVNTLRFENEELRTKYVPTELNVMSCPFCGSKNVEIKQASLGEDSKGYYGYYVSCEHCLAKGPKISNSGEDFHYDYMTEKEAVEYWNKVKERTETDNTIYVEGK